MSPDGRFVAAAVEQGDLSVFDTVTLKRIRKLAGLWPLQVTCSAAFSPDGQTLAVSDDSGGLKWWNVATGETLQTIQGHVKLPDGLAWHWDWISPQAMGASLSFSPDGRRLASAGPGNLVTVRNVATGAEVFRLTHAGPVSAVLFRPDGKRILSCEPGKLKEWDAGSGTLIRESEINAYIRCVALCYRGDSPCIVEVSGVGTTVWDAAAGREIFVLQHVQSIMTAVSPDGKRLATVDTADFSPIHVWDVDTGRELLSFKFERIGPDLQYKRKLAFSADGKRVFHYVSTLTVWDVSTTP